jgi:hypothetical protein
MNNYYTIEPTQELQGTAYNLWQPDSSVNDKIRVDTSINSNWKYRQYMQKNANQIMKYNSMQTIYTSGNNPYTVSNTNPTGNTPFLYNSLHDNSQPLYGYRDSDLKQDYMSKTQMKAKMISPSISTNF